MTDDIILYRFKRLLHVRFRNFFFFMKYSKNGLHVSDRNFNETSIIE